MRNYEGPALMLHEDTEIDVVAALTVDSSGHQEEWGGTLEASGGTGEDFERFKGHPVMLRLPDGHEGEALLTWTNMQGSARVMGSSEAPF